MPETTYMVVDPRRDHSIRIPRPDLSVKLGVPNACTRCHTDRSNVWAVETMHNWYGESKQDWQDFATVLYEARRGNPAVAPELEALIGNESMPAIVRATLLMELPRYLSSSSLPVIRDTLKDPDPLVRQATINALSNTNPDLRLKLLFPLLDDSVRAVRLAATRALMDLPVEQLSDQQNEKLYLIITEYEKSLRVNADRPEALVQLGVLYSVQGRYLDAQQAYQRAIKLDDQFNAAYVNLADLFAQQNQETEARTILKQGLAVLPADPDLNHALGLSLIRSKQYNDAMPLLAKAAKLAPENARYSYVYAVALHSRGNASKAITTLETALQQHPYDRQIMEALVAFYREAGEMDKAAKMAGHLQ
jgi:tetratricopeptide (TPR) repeat protein